MTATATAEMLYGAGNNEMAKKSVHREEAQLCGFFFFFPNNLDLWLVEAENGEPTDTGGGRWGHADLGDGCVA